jgi:hypothetical protein
MNRRAPHGGKPPKPRKPRAKAGRPAERLYIADVQAALDHIWKVKPKKSS